jgi:hypothetical protein
VVVLRDPNGNQVRTAGKLRLHHNTLQRTLQELDVNIKALRVSRPPACERPFVCDWTDESGEEVAGLCFSMLCALVAAP